jgi:hypothetical protein
MSAVRAEGCEVRVLVWLNARRWAQVVLVGVLAAIWGTGLLAGWPRVIPWSFWLVSPWLGAALQRVEKPGAKWPLFGAIAWTVYGLGQIIGPTR